jgi:hypothetical protein
VRARDYAREQAEHAEQQVLTLKHQVNELLQDRIRLETQLLSRSVLTTHVVARFNAQGFIYMPYIGLCLQGS